MTTPSSQTPQATTSVPDQIQRHDLEALALELAAAAAVSKALKTDLKGIVSASLLAWTRAFGSLRGVQSGPKFQTLMDDVATQLARVQVDPGPVLLDYSGRARSLGVRQGFREAATTPIDLGPLRDFGAHVDAANATQNARDKVQAAGRLAGTKQRGSYVAVTEAMAPAQQAVNDIERSARTMTNTALNQGIADVAEHVDGQLLWLAEPDACVACLALSGSVVNVGDQFNPLATFGAKAISWLPTGGLTGPPRHPRCRCRATVWLGADGPMPDDLPQALRREAERSVLNGYAVPSESEHVRAQAADRLLARIGRSKNSRSPSGWQVPQSVKQRAERSLAKGTFTTGPVPTGRK